MFPSFHRKQSPGAELCRSLELAGSLFMCLPSSRCRCHYRQCDGDDECHDPALRQLTVFPMPELGTGFHREGGCGMMFCIAWFIGMSNVFTYYIYGRVFLPQFSMAEVPLFICPSAHLPICPHLGYILRTSSRRAPECCGNLHCGQRRDCHDRATTTASLPHTRQRHNGDADPHGTQHVRGCLTD